MVKALCCFETLDYSASHPCEEVGDLIIFSPSVKRNVRQTV